MTQNIADLAKQISDLREQRAHYRSKMGAAILRSRTLQMKADRLLDTVRLQREEIADLRAKLEERS
jgi:chromosome segregation ATPase